MNQRRCNYLVVTSLPLRWCASAVAAATAASVAVAAATVQQRQRGTGARQCRRRGKGGGGRGGDTVLRSCLQHCKAAPQPRETGQKKRKCRSGSDGARDGTRGASEISFVRMGRDRTERERRRGARRKEREKKKEVCIRTRHTAIVAPGRSGMRKSPTPAAFFSCCVT